MIHSVLVLNRQGRVRLAKHYTDADEAGTARDVHRVVVQRDHHTQSSFVALGGARRLVYKRHAGLYFCMCIDAGDNALAHLAALQTFVDVLDAYFRGVSELDLVFSFYRAYAALDELVLAGEVQDTDRDSVLARAAHLERLG